jgi:signal transduction histidine kinase
MLQSDHPAADVGKPQDALRVRLQSTSFAKTGSRVLAGLIVYLLLTAAFIGWERRQLFDAVAEIERLHLQEESQHALNFSVSHAILSVNEHTGTGNLKRAAEILGLELDTVVSRLSMVDDPSGELAAEAAKLTRFNVQLQRTPSHALIAELRDSLHQLVLTLDRFTVGIHSEKQGVSDEYRKVFHRMTVELLVFMALGVAIIAIVSGVFFRQLSRDIGAVKQRAGEIVRGYRGAPLTVNRADELGDLMAAVNDMEAALKSREAQLDLGRQQQFHTEKMAAVGSLAAAVAHEINNPLAAIVGLAEDMVSGRDGGGHRGRRADTQIDLILDQARRVMTISRQLGEFSLQRPLEPAFIDLNSLVKSTCTFISFDKRFRGVSLRQDLAGDLPALFVVSDHIVQVLMNLLINAADALEGKQAPAEIIVRTCRDEASILLTVEDNGPGIAPEHIGRVFDTHFTTKPPGRGSGLGLSVCRSLLQQDGGEIVADSIPGRGATIRVTLPIPDQFEGR